MGLLRRFKIDTKLAILVVASIVGIGLSIYVGYLLADRLVDSETERLNVYYPEGYYIAQSWQPLMPYTPVDYVPMFSGEQTEDMFFERMSDIDRRSLYQLTVDFPELIENGWAHVYFDVTPYLFKRDAYYAAVLEQFSDAGIDITSLEGAADLGAALYDYALENAETVEDAAIRRTMLNQLILNGAVKTTQGHTILALDSFKSLMLAEVIINDTTGYIAIGYDKSKLALAITNRAHEGWWSTAREHIAHNEGAVVAIPANDFVYNRRLELGVVSGGFFDNSIPRYKMSGYVDLYMGFTREGRFAAGEAARFGMSNFSEGQGVLIMNGEKPVEVLVTITEQRQILRELALYIALSAFDTESMSEEELDAYMMDIYAPLMAAVDAMDVQEITANYVRVDVTSSWMDTVLENILGTVRELTGGGVVLEEVTKEESIAIITGFIDYQPDSYTRARYAWVIKENALKNASEASVTRLERMLNGELTQSEWEFDELFNLVVACDRLGADTYADVVVPTRSAFNAIGQRQDGATFFVGFGGSRVQDARELPGTGPTVEELQDLFIAYDASNAALITSGDKVGFAWGDTSMLRVQDTTTEGSRTYGAFILR